MKKIMSIWENYELDFIKNFVMGSWYTFNCPHVIEKDGKRIVPHVVIALNEGGYDSTGSCVDCILENYKKMEHKQIDGVARNEDRTMAWCGRKAVTKNMEKLLSIIKEHPTGINKIDLAKQSNIGGNDVALATKCLMEDKKITRGFEKTKTGIVAIYFPV